MLDIDDTYCILKLWAGGQAVPTARSQVKHRFPPHFFKRDCATGEQLRLRKR